MIKSSLWDVRNEYLYATEDGEGTATRVGPALVLKDIDSIAEAKQLAVTDFEKKLTERLIRLHAQQH